MAKNFLLACVFAGLPLALVVGFIFGPVPFPKRFFLAAPTAVLITAFCVVIAERADQEYGKEIIDRE